MAVFRFVFSESCSSCSSCQFIRKRVLRELTQHRGRHAAFKPAFAKHEGHTRGEPQANPELPADSRRLTQIREETLNRKQRRQSSFSVPSVASCSKILYPRPSVSSAWNLKMQRDAASLSRVP
jgi:hypothetical protein